MPAVITDVQMDALDVLAHVNHTVLVKMICMAVQAVEQKAAVLQHVNSTAIRIV